MYKKTQALNETETPEFTESTVFIQNGNYQIPAAICLPNGQGTFPAVVMLHGTGSDKNEVADGYKIAAHALDDAGIASIRIDFIGSGESSEDYINYNFKTAISDTDAAQNYIGGLEAVDPNRIGVMGWCQGGTIALLAAGSNQLYKSVLCWAGSIDLTLMVSEENYAIAKRDGFYNLTFPWRGSLQLGLSWFDDVHTTDVLEVFSNSNAPVMTINGSADVTVNPITGEEIILSSQNEQSRTEIIAGADHVFNLFSGDMRVFNQLMSTTIDWFIQTLTGQHRPDC
ncbi:alpha/beta fold hydrolase [Acetobacterium paludosum]|uniref:Alpha/beta fold hydrolase n=1 Tax=Acetobacterium paludosum TaxID=52693 RepID=A0A923HXT4_9FIRM|nr:alpha/beta fold hydrolase [Acetobacterium paludosum]MBC3887966.1 alpha/beta fold hydrolase [Acetobacterium paludosum]